MIRSFRRCSATLESQNNFSDVVRKWDLVDANTIYSEIMAAVYNSLSNGKDIEDSDDEETVQSTAKNKQRVLILSSRGVTYRCARMTMDFMTHMLMRNLRP